MSDCPDRLRLRALTEDALESDEAWVAAHVESCERCQRLVDLAREEEVALREALPAEPPAALLAKTLAAVKAEGAAPRAGRPARQQASSPLTWVVPLVAAGLAVVGLVWVSQRPDPPKELQPPTAEPDPRVEPPPPEPTSPGSPKKTLPPSQPGDPEPTPDPEPTDVIVNKTVDDPPQIEDPPPIRKTAEPARDPTVTRPQLLAKLRAGKVTHGRRTLAAGTELPLDVDLRAGSRVVEVECPSAARLLLAPRSRFRIARKERWSLELERGRVLATSIGTERYVVTTPEGVATPLGTVFLVARQGKRTRVGTVQGAVRLRQGQQEREVRAGFELAVQLGKPLMNPIPWSAPAKGLKWLPKDRRPASPTTPRVVATFGFERGADGFGKGRWRRSGAGGSKGCLQAVAHDDGHYSVVVEKEDLANGVLTLDPDLWVEVAVWVNKRTRVAVQIWDDQTKENWAHIVTVEPNRWVVLAAPLSRFTDPAGKPRDHPVQRGNRGTCFNVFATEGALRVDDVRAVLQPR